MKSLYQKLKEANVQMDSHESDLYFEITKESMEILRQHRIEWKEENGTPFDTESFRNNITGTLWMDVPLSYDPFWEAVAEKARLRSIS